MNCNEKTNQKKTWVVLLELATFLSEIKLVSRLRIYLFGIQCICFYPLRCKQNYNDVVNLHNTIESKKV